MIAFATLFLGLVLGVQPIELVVADGTATVELQLDGHPVALLDAPPWSFACDLGSALLPHELVAIARNGGGEETGRARQWINLPRDPAEASVVLEGGEDGRGMVARLSWESIAGEPLNVRVTFDGQTLAALDPRRITLPDHDPRQLHFLRAELDFRENVSSVAELSFGGTYSDQLSTELTAVPVELAGRRDLPAADQLKGWFLADGSPLTVVATEEGPVELALVVDQGAYPLIHRMGVLQGRRLLRPGNLSPSQASVSMRHLIPLKDYQRLRFVAPYAEQRQTARHSFELFSRTRDLTRDDCGLFWALAVERPPVAARAPQRLADAVAVAAMNAASRGRRRAVILVLGASPEDASELEPAQVVGYLRALGVPLEVWSMAGGEPPPAGAWGPVKDASTMAKLETVFNRAARSLDRQRIVWLGGHHLPHEIELSQLAREASLVR